MADNTWVHEDRGGHPPSSKVLNVKVILTVVLVISSAVGVIVFHNVGSGASLYQAEGVVVDFGNYQTCWADVDYSEQTSDPVEMLGISAKLNNLTYSFSADDVLESVSVTVGSTTTTYTNSADTKWGLWYISKGDTEYTQSDSYGIDASDYSVVSWAFVKDGGTPTVALDMTGTCVYGYAKPQSIVTLSPVATEIVGSLHAASSITGTDSFSNYPSAVAEGHAKGTIATVGSYTSPEYESIMALSPDVVFCDGSQLSHQKMANSLRNSNVNAVVLYDGDDIQSIINNIFLAGAAIGYTMYAEKTVGELISALSEIAAKTSLTEGSDVMYALGSNASPYCAASGTYIDDIITTVGGSNVFSDVDGWPQVISEYISERNPKCIIVRSDVYGADDYNQLLNSLNQTWKSTDAYRNGNIYLLCDGLADLSDRSGPRFIQLTEIVARIVNPDAFDDGIVPPKAIGSDYAEYLTITKDMEFDYQ